MGTGHSRAILSRFNRRRKTQLLPTLQNLYDAFGDRNISSGIWLARSPDFNLCYSSSEVCLRDKVYISNPRTEKELKENIRKEVENIPAEQLQRVNQNLLRRCEDCLYVQGQYFQHLPVSVNCNYFIRNVIGTLLIRLAAGGTKVRTSLYKY
jgi:hypothetical protein